MKLCLKPALFFFSLVITSLLVVLCFPMLVHAAPPVILHAAYAPHAAQGIRGKVKSIRREIKTIRGKAETAARKAPQAVPLAYLQCYPLGETAKKACQDKIHTPLLQNLPKQAHQNFIYEAERLGFAAFLRQQGKACPHIDEGPKFSEKHKAYIVQCTDNSGTGPIGTSYTGTSPTETMPTTPTYLMRFDGKTWSLLDEDHRGAF